MRYTVLVLSPGNVFRTSGKVFHCGVFTKFKGTPLLLFRDCLIYYKYELNMRQIYFYWKEINNSIIHGVSTASGSLNIKFPQKKYKAFTD